MAQKTQAPVPKGTTIDHTKVTGGLKDRTNQRWIRQVSDGTDRSLLNQRSRCPKKREVTWRKDNTQKNPATVLLFL